MNKKISLLILGAYMSTNIAPTLVFAEQNVEQNTTLLTQDQELGLRPDMIAGDDTIRANVTVSYVDADDNTLAPSITFDDIKEEVLQNGLRIYEFVPKEIHGKEVASVTVNGKNFSADTVLASFAYTGDAYVDMDLDIVWHYTDNGTGYIDGTVYHNSYLGVIIDQFHRLGGPIVLDTTWYTTELEYEHIQGMWSSNKDSVCIETTSLGVPATDTKLNEWLTSEYGLLGTLDIKESGDRLVHSSPASKITYRVDEDKQSFNLGDTIYAYKYYEDQNQVLGETVLSKDSKGIYSGTMEDFFAGGLNIFSTKKIPTEVNLLELMNKEVVDGEETETPETPEHIEGQFNHTVAYLKDFIRQGVVQFHAGNGMEAPILAIHSDNIKMLTDGREDSEVLKMQVSHEVLSEAAKSFEDRFKNDIIGDIVSYVSDYNTGGGDFVKANTFSMNIFDDSIKVGQHLTLYIFSENSSDAVEVYGTVEEVKDNQIAYKTVEFQFPEDVLGNSTFFVTTHSNVYQIITDKTDDYIVPYSYIRDYIGTEDLLLHKGQDFTPTFSIKNANLQNILKTKDESFVLSVDINGKYLDENIKALTGLSKSFYDRYSKQVYRWVSYKSNLGEKEFEHKNTISFPIDTEIPEGATVYLYTTSNLKNGKVTLLGEVRVENKDVGGHGAVSFDTNIDIADRTFFLTTSKIELTEKGELPDTGGMAMFTLIGGAVAVIAGGSLLLFGKKKK